MPLVFDTKPGSGYDDHPSARYHFPNRYRQRDPGQDIQRWSASARAAAGHQQGDAIRRISTRASPAPCHATARSMLGRLGRPDRRDIDVGMPAGRTREQRANLPQRRLVRHHGDQCRPSPSAIAAVSLDAVDAGVHTLLNGKIERVTLLHLRSSSMRVAVSAPERGSGRPSSLRTRSQWRASRSASIVMPSRASRARVLASEYASSPRSRRSLAASSRATARAANTFESHLASNSELAIVSLRNHAGD